MFEFNLIAVVAAVVAAFANLFDLSITLWDRYKKRQRMKRLHARRK